MKKQLEMVDIDGMTILMHSSSGSSSSAFQALSQCVQASQFRAVIKAKDAEGMTLLHHAVSGKGDQRASTQTATAATAAVTSAGVRTPPTDAEHELETHNIETPSAGEMLATATGEGGDSIEGQASVEAPFVLDPRLPVIQSVLEFARENLWMPEYRKLLQARDGWHRNVIEHAIMSGQTQTFETVFDALRRDLLDDKIDLMLDPGSEPSYTQTSMSRALESQKGTAMPQFVIEKTKSLKSDVSRRKDDSTVANKIQTFIPGNLIVIFQLLLPEFEEESDAPLYLLLVLCFISPFWSWGVAMSIKRDPETKNTRARQTAAKHFLTIPAMFFWGLGTSKIASTSFGWAETAAAAALAVATIVIPALDTYFSGRGARATVSVITIFLLDLVDGRKAKSTGAAERSNQLYGRDDIASAGVFTSSRLQGPTLVKTNTRHAADTHRSMEAGQTPATRVARRNMTINAEGSPTSQQDRPQQSPVESIWAEDDGIESKL
ncbi:unnamed protein product [Pylaiella littoralis]